MTEPDVATPGQDDLADRIARIEAIMASKQAPSSVFERILRYVPFLAIGNFALAAPAFLISAAVAYFSFIQADATEKMQIATVWPHLNYATGNLDDSGKPVILLTVGNQGVGPAKVEGMEVSYQGKAYRDAESLIKACCVAEGWESPFVITSRLNGMVLRPGEETNLIRLDPENATPQVFESLDANRFDVRVKACYCSVFEDCWVMDSQARENEPVKACPANWAQFGFPDPSTSKP